MSMEFSHLHEKLPKSEKILLDLLYEFDQLAYKNFDLQALSREILKLFNKGFSGYNCKPAIKIFFPEKIMFKIEDEKVVIAEEKDFNTLDTVSINVFNEQTFKEDEIGKITFPTGDGLDSDEKDILFFIFSVLSQKTSRLIESAIKRVVVQSEKLDLQEKNQLLENIHMFMMQATEIVIGDEESEHVSEADAIELQKICLYQAIKDAFELNFWVEPVVIFSNSIKDKLVDKYKFSNVFQEDENFTIKRKIFKGEIVEDLSKVESFTGLSYTLVSYLGNEPTHIFGLGNCGLTEDGKLSTVVLETVQLMLNIFALSYQTILKKEELFHQSVKDGLTGLFNRRYFDSTLRIEIERCARSIEPYFSLVMFDIDHFKKFNDTYGHQTGDDVLQEVATAVLNSIRKTDIFCRYGGEEFIIIASGINEEQALIVAEKARKVVEQLEIVTPIDKTNVKISLGVAQFFAGDDAEGILKKADSALYYSKEHGRNRSSAYSKTIKI